MNGVLLKNCYSVKPFAGAAPLRRHDILIEGTTIAKIAPSIASTEGVRVVDCSSHLVVPGSRYLPHRQIPNIGIGKNRAVAPPKYL